ncbi:MAG TPA: class I SAM-dependent methyltransferase [Candidatus Paceibacterota bacterium]
MDNLISERNYQRTGFDSQRRYPNEQAVQFLAWNYFSLSRAKRKNIKMLELGCGSGANLWMIAKEGFDTYGMDIAPTAIQLCKRMLAHYGVKAKLNVGNIKKLNFKSNFFDAVIDVMTIEHTDLGGHKDAYTEVFRCLKKGGRFFSWHLGAQSTSFIYGNGKKLDRYTIDNIRNPHVPFPDTGITCFITAPLVKRMLIQAGFTGIIIERVTRTYKQMTQKTECFAISARKPKSSTLMKRP